MWLPMGSAPAGFAQLAVGYRTRHSVSKEDLKRGIAHVSWKSHQNGVHSPKAHLRKAISMDAILGAPMIAEPLGLFDCCGVSRSEERRVGKECVSTCSVRGAAYP